MTARGGTGRSRRRVTAAQARTGAPTPSIMMARDSDSPAESDQPPLSGSQRRSAGRGACQCRHCGAAGGPAGPSHRLPQWFTEPEIRVIRAPDGSDRARGSESLWSAESRRRLGVKLPQPAATVAPCTPARPGGRDRPSPAAPENSWQTVTPTRRSESAGESV
jgi:hypothetical protein